MSYLVSLYMRIFFWMVGGEYDFEWVFCVADSEEEARRRIIDHRFGHLPKDTKFEPSVEREIKRDIEQLAGPPAGVQNLSRGNCFELEAGTG
ncbi:MAG: hypothetical protein ACYCOU_02970 [Sulfobacillus sp.]